MAISERTPDEQLSGFLSRFPSDIVTLTNRTLQKLRRIVPGCNEIVYDYTKSVVISFSMSDKGYQAIVAVAIYPDGIRLYLDKTLPDPKGLLEGSGGKVRYVTLKSASAMDRGPVNALVKAAVNRSGAIPRTGSTRMIIKSKPAKRKARSSGKKRVA